MSGNAGVAVAVAVVEALGLALGEAAGLAEAEALEAGLATALSTPRSSIPLPLSSKPRSLSPRACPYRLSLCRRLHGRPRRVRTPTWPTPPTRYAITIYASFLLFLLAHPRKGCTTQVRMPYTNLWIFSNCYGRGSEGGDPLSGSFAWMSGQA